MNHEELFLNVSKYLEEYDYEGLMKYGAPGGEFDSEARKICNRISAENSVEEIAEVIADVISKNFLTEEKPQKFMELAQKIKHDL